MEVLLQIDERLRRLEIEMDELRQRRVIEVNVICHTYRQHFPKIYGIGKLDEQGIIYDLGLFARLGDAERELQQFAKDKFCVRHVESGKVVNGWLIKLIK